MSPAWIFTWIVNGTVELLKTRVVNETEISFPREQSSEVFMPLLPVIAGVVTACAAWVLTGPAGPLDPLTAEVTAIVFAVGAAVSSLRLAAVAE